MDGKAPGHPGALVLASPTDIPIVANRKWDIWSNRALLDVAGIELPRSIKHRAKRVK